jgi:regulator of sigma E protease
MKQPPQPWEFRSKKSWQRLMIMTGGVLFNFILALLIFVFVLFAWGETYLPTSSVKFGIVTDSVGHSIGLRNGDKILSVDNMYIEDFSEIYSDIILNDRKSIQVERGGDTININIPTNYVPKMLKGKGQILARTPFSKYTINRFLKESPAELAGVLKGDELLTLDNMEFIYSDDFQNYLASRKNREVTLNILRNGERLDIPVVVTSAGMIGVEFSRPGAAQYFEMKTLRYGFFESFPAGIKKGFKAIVDYLKQFRLIFSKDTKAYESLGGFITIGSIFPGAWDWQAFWNLTALLSIILAVMNILPIPALDGGHVMFLLFEVITGRKPSDKFLEYAQIAGMIILLALLIYANGNDIIRLIRK